jgi:hypothetical protein
MYLLLTDFISFSIVDYNVNESYLVARHSSGWRVLIFLLLVLASHHFALFSNETAKEEPNNFKLSYHTVRGWASKGQPQFTSLTLDRAKVGLNSVKIISEGQQQCSLPTCYTYHTLDTYVLAKSLLQLRIDSIIF